MMENRSSGTLVFTSKSSVNRIVIGLSLVLVGILIGAIPFLVEVKARRTAGQAVTLGLISVTAGTLFLFSSLRYRRIHVTTRADGVSLAVNLVERRCGWSDIAQVREIHNKSDGDLMNKIYSAAQGSSHVFEVTCHNGRVLKFNNLIADLPRLGAVIQEATLPHLYPPAFESVCQGEVVSFGSVSVDEHQFTAGPKQMLAWPQVQEVKVDNGCLQVFQFGQKGAWCTKPIADVPNAHVLMRLVKMLQAAAAADPEMARRALEATPVASTNFATQPITLTQFLLVLGGLAIVVAALFGGVGLMALTKKSKEAPGLLTVGGVSLILGMLMIGVGIKVRKKPAAGDVPR